MEGPEIKAVEAVIDNGSFGKRTLRFETGRLAQQADGAVAAYLDDDSMILSTTTAGSSPKENYDFFPLTVDVEEKMYAAGKIPGSFFRREGRPSSEAILACRIIDRPLRERSAASVCEQVKGLLASTGWEEVGLLSLATCDWNGLPEAMEKFAPMLADNQIKLSLPSLRVDAFSVNLAAGLESMRKGGLTFAPEAGTQPRFHQQRRHGRSDRGGVGRDILPRLGQGQAILYDGAADRNGGRPRGHSGDL